MKTELKDRTLWFDGDMTIKPSSIYDFVDRVGSDKIGSIAVEELTDEIEQYNLLSPPSERIHIKHSLKNIEAEWNIPDEYKQLDVLSYAREKLDALNELESYSESEYLDRLERLVIEYKEFKRLKLLPLLRTLIYVINTFERDGVVWGPGRGSSVSSYLLFVIGVHDVDSVFFELEISDFMKHIKQ